MATPLRGEAMAPGCRFHPPGGRTVMTGYQRLLVNRGRRSRQEADTHQAYMLAFKGKHATRRRRRTTPSHERQQSRMVRHGHDQRSGPFHVGNRQQYSP